VGVLYNQTLYAWVWIYGFKHHFPQYFSYNVVVSFIGGGNWSTQRKPLTCRKSQIRARNSFQLMLKALIG
jgi:hypothetical protein